MELLPAELKVRLPPLAAVADMDEPFVLIHYRLPGTELQWWVSAGEAEENDFMFFGFISGINHFRHFRLSELKARRGPGGAAVQRDNNFIEGGLSEVVPAPEI